MASRHVHSPNITIHLKARDKKGVVNMVQCSYNSSSRLLLLCLLLLHDLLLRRAESQREAPELIGGGSLFLLDLLVLR